MLFSTDARRFTTACVSVPGLLDCFFRLCPAAVVKIEGLCAVWRHECAADDVAVVMGGNQHGMNRLGPQAPPSCL